MDPASANGLTSYTPRSPDLSGYRPQSPDLSAYRPQSPDFSAPAVPSYTRDYAPVYAEPALGSLGIPHYAAASLGHAYKRNREFDEGWEPTSAPAYQPSPHSSSPYQQQAANEVMPSPQRILSTRTKKRTSDDEFMPDAPATKITSRGRKVRTEPANPATTESLPGGVNVKGVGGTASEGIEVKTKFPTARIKRIMQADEDVGKVAQVTPVVVAKALELFMISLITKSSAIAKSKSSRRVMAPHLKAAILADDQLDFLHEIVGKVPDQPTGTRDRDGSEEASGDAKSLPKKGGGKSVPNIGVGGRKKRAKSEDD
ncbi:DR1-associated protein 1 (negative cofactor 2 alpha) [Elasticomyces elasticus]|nr:DR1-associated protein 1 (negative cofactor 2 alpha) [Elasticomyces elasticus]